MEAQGIEIGTGAPIEKTVTKEVPGYFLGHSGLVTGRS